MTHSQFYTYNYSHNHQTTIYIIILRIIILYIITERRKEKQSNYFHIQQLSLSTTLINEPPIPNKRVLLQILRIGCPLDLNHLLLTSLFLSRLVWISPILHLTQGIGICIFTTHSNPKPLYPIDFCNYLYFSNPHSEWQGHLWEWLLCHHSPKHDEG